MCGIFGVVLTKDAPVSVRSLRRTVADLFRLSESRGKEAAGVAMVAGNAIHVYKEAVPASTMVRRRQYRDLFDRTLRNGSLVNTGLGQPVAIIGHSRLVTTGAQQNRLNNQPVINRGAVGIHNGIIVNDQDLWRRFPAMRRQGEVDSEVILGLIRHFLAEGKSLTAAVQETFRLIQGTASVAVLFDDMDCMVLATNNGSLYRCGDSQHKVLVFASERHILAELTRKRRVNKLLSARDITQVRPGEAYLINLQDLSQQKFSLQVESGPDVHHVGRNGSPRQVIDIPPTSEGDGHGRSDYGRRSVLAPSARPPIPFDPTATDVLRRCTRCILPETMPFIEFDDQGVCNYCWHYQKVKVRGPQTIEELVAPYRSRSGEPDCLVGLSGGRDSTYGLHYVKTVLKMNPLAYTYDWGMVTDLARRNISRICGKLGVEHILVSAHIAKKRRFIRQNVLAWLKKPDLGMVPLFMAGDKQYFYHARKLKRQTGVPLIFLCENMLERTDFKAGFSGVRPWNADAEHVYTLPILSKLTLVGHYARQYLSNPAYLNASVPDTIFAYACYYLIERDYLNLYGFVRWDEQRIVSTLVDEYDWELASDTKTTWRIGDGTAPFYNYIYYTVAGFSEHDTFRSNQVREGILTRDEALRLARELNQPRWESIKWYLDTIGLGDDFEAIVRRINAIPKLYHR